MKDWSFPNFKWHSKIKLITRKSSGKAELGKVVHILEVRVLEYWKEWLRDGAAHKR
jgi:hypothetical protein